MVEISSKTEALGHVPMDKVSAIVGDKAWNDHQRKVAALTEARNAVTASKQAVRTALAKHFKLAGDIDFTVEATRLRLFRQPQKQPRASLSKDLTLAATK
jgi:hypothetical protein